MERTPLFANTACDAIFDMMSQFHIVAGDKRVAGLAQIKIFVYRAYLYLLWAGLAMVTIQAGSLHILVGKRTDERIVFSLSVDCRSSMYVCSIYFRVFILSGTMLPQGGLTHAGYIGKGA